MLTERFRHVLITALGDAAQASADARRAVYDRARNELSTWCHARPDVDAALYMAALERAVADVEALSEAPADEPPPQVASSAISADAGTDADAPVPASVAADPQRRSPDAAAILDLFDAAESAGDVAPPPAPAGRPRRGLSPRLAAALLVVLGVLVVVLARPETSNWLTAKVSLVLGARPAIGTTALEPRAETDGAVAKAMRAADALNDATGARAAVVAISRGDDTRADAVPLRWSVDGTADRICDIVLDEAGLRLRLTDTPATQGLRTVYVTFDAGTAPLLRSRRPTLFDQRRGRPGAVVGEATLIGAATILYGIEDHSPPQPAVKVVLGAELDDGRRIDVILTLPPR